MKEKAKEIMEHETLLFWFLATIFALFIASYIYLALFLLSGWAGALIAIALFLTLGSISLFVLSETKKAMVRKISDTRRR